MPSSPPPTPARIAELKEAVRRAEWELNHALTYSTAPSSALLVDVEKAGTNNTYSSSLAPLDSPITLSPLEDEGLISCQFLNRMMLLTLLILLVSPLPTHTGVWSSHASIHEDLHDWLGLSGGSGTNASSSGVRVVDGGVITASDPDYGEWMVEAGPDPEHCIGDGGWPSEPASRTTGKRYVANPVGPGYGIGNQLFSLAAALSYALDYHRCLVLPSSYFHPSSVNSRPYTATVFRHFWLQPHLWDALEPSGVKVFDNPDSYTWQPGMSMHAGPFEEPAIVHSGRAPDHWMVVLRGGYQHVNYTWHHRDAMRAYLRPHPRDTAALLAKYPGLRRGVAVHFRRGDFVALEKLPEVSKRDFPIPSTFFYSQSSDALQEDYRGGGWGAARASATTTTAPDGSSGAPLAPLVYFIFTNDYPWARNQSWVQALPGELVFVEDEDEVYSFYMMMLAREGVICANSTFCWWAAYLGASKRQYLPNHWYNSPGHEPTGIHYPGTTVMHSDNINEEGPRAWYPSPSTPRRVEGGEVGLGVVGVGVGVGVGGGMNVEGLKWPAF